MSLVCRRLYAAFPASLPRRSDDRTTLEPRWIRLSQRHDGRRVQSLADWSRAYALAVIGWRFTDAGVAALANVHTLDLRFSEVTDAGVAALANVHTLDLRRTQITDAGVGDL